MTAAALFRPANALLLLVLVAATLRAQSETPPLALRTEDGFAVPQPGAVLEFPAAHGSHPDFRLEWWYITGHLFGPAAERFGFQATFFRTAGPRHGVSSPAEPAPSPSAAAAFGTETVFLAHMALLEVSSGRFLHQERLHRAGWAADAAVGRLDLRNGNWSLRMTDPVTERMELRGSIDAAAAFVLVLEPSKPRVRFGEDGVSRKGADATAASHYITFPRLAVAGTLTLDGRTRPVTGQAWMDHEISSSQLAEDQIGWDWVSMHLDDGRELMVYRLRRRDGSTDPFSRLWWIDRDGGLVAQTPDRWTWHTRGTWRSPATGARYPVRTVLRAVDPATGRERELQIEPLAEAQELTGGVGGIAYWEGACRVLGEDGRPVGSAFVELTGYADDLRERMQ
jgi:predicted secreted hydrolase